MIDKENTKVTMSLADFEYLQSEVNWAKLTVDKIKRTIKNYHWEKSGEPEEAIAVVVIDKQKAQDLIVPLRKVQLDMYLMGL